MKLRVGLRLEGDGRCWIPHPGPEVEADLFLEVTGGDPDVWMALVCGVCMLGHVGYFADAAMEGGCPWVPCEACGKAPIRLQVMET